MFSLPRPNLNLPSFVNSSQPYTEAGRSSVLLSLASPSQNASTGSPVSSLGKAIDPA